MNPIAIRLLSQQLSSPQFNTPTEVVNHMGAMQAQDYRMMRWAVMMRTKKPSAELFNKAYNSGEIIRLHLLRGTWQIVSAKDYWWLLTLCAHKAEKIIKGWMKSNKVIISDKELHTTREILLQEAEVKGSATKNDFATALSERGITMDSHRLSYHIRLAELNGTLCSGNLSPMQATYSLTETKVKHTSPMNKDEMLVLLARKYFQSHSPATIEDFVWWSGMNVADCKKAIELLTAELHKETWKGYAFYLHESCRTRGFRKGNTLLLPPFDEYLIGYKSRSLVISPDHTQYAYTNNGIFFPVIAHDGRICGNWNPWSESIERSYFIPNDEESAIEAQWNEFYKIRKYCQFL